MIGQVDLVGAVRDVFLHHPAESRVLGQGIVHPLLRPVAEDDGAHLGVDFDRQLPRPGEELKRHAILKIIPVVSENPDVPFFFAHFRSVFRSLPMAPPILSSNRSKSCSTIRLGAPVRTTFFFPAVGE